MARWPRRRAVLRACLERDRRDAARCPSRFRARLTARDRVEDGRRRLCCPARYARAALLRVLALDCPRRGGFRRTPDRRAFDKPMAIACLVDRAPCLPRRTCSISSRTNSPACVLAALPCRLSRRARFTVLFSGMDPPVWPFPFKACAHGACRAEARSAKAGAAGAGGARGATG